MSANGLNPRKDHLSADDFDQQMKLSQTTRIKLSNFNEEKLNAHVNLESPEIQSVINQLEYVNPQGDPYQNQMQYRQEMDRRYMQQEDRRYVQQDEQRYNKQEEQKYIQQEMERQYAAQQRNNNPNMNQQSRRDSIDSLLDDTPGPKKSDTQMLAEFLRTTGPQQPSPPPVKKGFFGWVKKERKEKDKKEPSEKLATRKPTTFQPPQNVLQNSPSSRRQSSLPSQRQPIDIASQMPAPMDAPQQNQPDQSQAPYLPFEEDTESFEMDFMTDKELMQNTDFNAGFIEIESNYVKQPSKVNKGVSFSDVVEDMEERYYEEQQMANQTGPQNPPVPVTMQNPPMMPNPAFMDPMRKPMINSRGSSLKNLAVDQPQEPIRNPVMGLNKSGSMEDIQRVNSFEKQPPLNLVPMVLPPQKTARQNPPNATPIFNPRESSSPANSPAFNQPMMTSMPPLPKTTGPMPNIVTEPVRTISTGTASSEGESSFSQEVFNNIRLSSPEIPPSPESFDKSRKKVRHVQQQTKNIQLRDMIVQTDLVVEDKSEENAQLLARIAALEAEVSTLKEENGMMSETMQEQKRGFDKLSAQAYKKIKELLTDRNIMSIEIKSLHAQMDQMELQYQEWTENMEP
ncbi:hypothetical protein HDV02_004359 [Globomyces sp. JEL0801]|nr:hypothetical protein HDV02_004359 [Globomyces sp. JEL0801]